MIIRIIKFGDVVYENIEPYYIDENGNKIWNIPTDINELKQALIDTVRWQARKKLQETDWIVVKCVEKGLDPTEEYPEEVTLRQKIRDWCNQKEEEIQNAESIEDLLAIDVKIPY